MQPQNHLRTLAIGQLDVASLPQVLPFADVACQELIKARRMPDGLHRLEGGLGDGEIPRGEKGDDLFDLSGIGWSLPVERLSHRSPRS